MKYMYLKVKVRVTISDSFHALMRIESQNKIKSVNVARPRSRLYHIVQNDSARTVTTKCKLGLNIYFSCRAGCEIHSLETDCILSQ